MTRRASAVGVLAACAAAGVVASVAAQEDKAVALEWVAPAECPNGAYVDREIARLLAGDPVAPERRLRVRADVTHADGRWRVRIRTSGAGGTGDRSLDAATCRALADATALIAALAVDPARVAANRAASSASAPSASASALPSSSASASASPPAIPSASASSASATSASPPASSAPSPPPPPAPPAPLPPPPPASSAPLLAPSTPPPPASPATPSAPTEISVGLSGTVDSATLPHATPGAALRVGVRPGGARWLRLEAAAAPFANATTGAGTTRGADFSLLAFDVGACFPVALDAWELAPCLAWEAARIGGTGNGPSAPQSGASWIPRLLPGGSASLRLVPWLLLRADLAVGIAFARPEFVVGGFDAGLVHRPATLSARAGLGFEARF